MEHQQVSHYRILRLIARGGMGEVYEAEDLHLGRRVAIKFVAPELAADAESLKRFEREAVAAGALNHPHIATLHAFDPSHRPPFLVMELLSGETLRSRLEVGPLPVEEAIALIRDVAGALDFAHGREVVHRDIKPENLMFDQHGTLKVTDFGLARLARSSRVTTEGSVLGTATYMAPECTRAEAAAPADVFALGVVLHEMLAGTPPFVGEGALGVLYAIANQEPRPLRELRPDVPEEIEKLALAMLGKDPGSRPSAVEVYAALGGRTTQHSARSAGASIPGGPSSGARPRGPGAVRLRSFPRVLWLGAGAAAVLLGLGLVWVPLRARGQAEAVGLNNRGIEALQRGDVPRAQAMFEQALRRDPGSGQARLNLALGYQAQGQVARAESLLRVVLRRHARDVRLVAQARYNLGSIDLDTGAWESAVENLRLSFQADSSAARIYNNYGLALVRAGQPQEGLPLLLRGVARFPGVAPLHKNSGLALMELGRGGEARFHLVRALELDSTLTEARALLARAGAAPP